MKRALLFLAVNLAAAAAAPGQTMFRADLTGDQEVPPVATDAGGWGRFTLNSDDTVTYHVATWGLAGVAAHVHIGDEGVSGGILFGLDGGPTVWSGTSPPLAASDKALLRGRGLYVNVHTADNPGGEVRGQIEVRPVSFGAHITGDQEVPPTGSSAAGAGLFSVNADHSITFDVDVSGLAGLPVAAHIHAGDFGASGGIVFDLGSGPPWTGTTPPMTADEYDALQAKGLYVNIHTDLFPGGEVRGQLVASGVPYGRGCPSSAGDVELLATGAPVPGGVLTLSVSGGRPSSSGVLVGSLSDGASLAAGCPYLLGTPIFFLGLPLSGSGSIDVTSGVPPLAGSFDVYFQFVDFDDLAPDNGKYATSNGLLVPLTVF